MPKISSARRQERRRQILSAAAVCFARKGFHETTILDICREAGLSAGAVYGHFRTKDSIIEAMLESGRESMLGLLAQAGPAASARERIAILFREFERPGPASAFQLDVRSWSEAIGNRRMREAYLRVRSEWIRLLAEILADVAAERGVGADTLAEFALAVITGCELRKAIQPAADVRPVADTFLAFLA